MNIPNKFTCFLSGITDSNCHRLLGRQKRYPYANPANSWGEWIRTTDTKFPLALILLLVSITNRRHIAYSFALPTELLPDIK